MVVIILLIYFLYFMNLHSRNPRKRLTKAEKAALYQSRQFAHIQSREDLVAYLSKDAENPYNKLVLELVQREQTLTEEQRSAFDEKHHIIPVRKGGPDVAWNLVSVTYEEHCKLHEILFELYGEEGDYKAANARKNAGPETRQAKIELLLVLREAKAQVIAPRSRNHEATWDWILRFKPSTRTWKTFGRQENPKSGACFPATSATFR